MEFAVNTTANNYSTLVEISTKLTNNIEKKVYNAIKEILEASPNREIDVSGVYINAFGIKSVQRIYMANYDLNDLPSEKPYIYVITEEDEEDNIIETFGVNVMINILKQICK